MHRWFPSLVMQILAWFCSHNDQGKSFCLPACPYISTLFSRTGECAKSYFYWNWVQRFFNKYKIAYSMILHATSQYREESRPHKSETKRTLVHGHQIHIKLKIDKLVVTPVRENRDHMSLHVYPPTCFPYLLLLYFRNYIWIVSGQEDPSLRNRLTQLQLLVEALHFFHVHTEVNVNCFMYKFVRPSNLQAEMWGSETASMYRENSVRFEENSEDGSTKRNTRSQIT